MDVFAKCSAAADVRRPGNNLIDNAGVIQIFGARNLWMAQDLANIIGGVSAGQVMSIAPDEQMLLMEGKLTRCKQVR